jgi:glutaredoxin
MAQLLFLKEPPVNPMRAVPLFVMPLVALTACFMTTVPLQAQTVYRTVGPDGRVTFSDKPPQEGSGKVPVASAAPAAPASGSTLITLPYVLRRAVSQYPVTLYASAACTPCDAGRTLLKARGIPFAEKSISSNEDIDALKRISGDISLPVLTVGGQKIKGLSETQWTQALDTAGFPSTSALPASYRFGPATPLAPVPKPAEPVADKPQNKPENRPAGPPSEAPGPARNPNNPAGISF